MAVTDDMIADVYADCYSFVYNPFGVTLTFQLSDPKAIGPDEVPRMPKGVVRVRMSMEAFKLMLLKSVRTVKLKEHGEGISVNLPVALLNMERIAPEDWSDFWRM